MNNSVAIKQESFFLLKTIVQNYSGSQTEMLTIFNKSIGWEEACIGVRKGLMHQENIECCKIEIFYVSNGKHNLIAIEEPFYFEEMRKEYLQNLLQKAS